MISFLIVGIVTHIQIPSIFKCLFSSSCEFEKFDEEYEDSVALTHSFVIILILIIIVVKYIYANFLRKYQKRVDSGIISPNDFTIYVSGF